MRRKYDLREQSVGHGAADVCFMEVLCCGLTVKRCLIG